MRETHVLKKPKSSVRHLAIRKSRLCRGFSHNMAPFLVFTPNVSNFCVYDRGQDRINTTTAPLSNVATVVTIAAIEQMTDNKKCVFSSATTTIYAARADS